MFAHHTGFGMTVAKIKELLAERPFRPFIVYQSNGRHHLIEHPELAIPTQSTLYIFGPPQPGDDGLSGPVVISYLHIASIVYLPGQAA